MNNPFTLSFGRMPNQFISRVLIKNSIIEDFTSDFASSQIYMLTGVRGAGKTVAMTEIKSELSKNKEWICIELNPERDMLRALASRLYADEIMHIEFEKAKIDLSLLGIGLSIEKSIPISDEETAVRRMLEQLKKHNKKLLLTVDEVTNNQYVREFAAAFQIFIREDFPVYMIMAGLRKNIEELQDVKSLTFLYRAPKVEVENLDINEVVRRYKRVFDISDKEATEMATLTLGYSYAFQALGYLKWEKPDMSLNDLEEELLYYLSQYVYDKIWSELSNRDKEIILSIAELEDAKPAKIRERICISTNEMTNYKNRLAKKGIIAGRAYSSLKLVLPLFDKYAISQKYNI